MCVRVCYAFIDLCVCVYQFHDLHVHKLCDYFMVTMETFGIIVARTVYMRAR